MWDVFHVGIGLLKPTLLHSPMADFQSRMLLLWQLSSQHDTSLQAPVLQESGSATVVVVAAAWDICCKNTHKETDVSDGWASCLVAL